MSDVIIARLLYITNGDSRSKITEDTFKLSPKGSMIWLSYSGLEDAKCCAIFLHKASNMKTFYIHHNPVSDIVHGYDVRFELFNTQYLV